MALDVVLRVGRSHSARPVFLAAGGAAAVGPMVRSAIWCRASRLSIAESISLATIPLAKKQFVAVTSWRRGTPFTQAFKLLLVTQRFSRCGAVSAR